ncbi:hypothetical protein C3L33_01486, partial [Rhododendron williamsianum]
MGGSGRFVSHPDQKPVPPQITANRTAGYRQPSGPFGVVFDPRSEIVQKWNRAVLMARGVALAVDPVFFFSLAVNRGGRPPGVYVDGGVAAVVAVVRTCVDAVHLCHLLVQFRLAYVSRESLVFIPKVYHSFFLMQRMRKVTGYVFGTIWWGFALNLIVYFLASHVRCWRMLVYSLNSKNSIVPLTAELHKTGNYQTFEIQRNRNSTIPKMARTELCFDESGAFPYGIYQFALPLISTNSTAIKILYSNLWGLMALSEDITNITCAKHDGQQSGADKQVLRSVVLHLCGAWRPNALHITDRKEEEDAGAISGRAVVDEKETTYLKAYDETQASSLLGLDQEGTSVPLLDDLILDNICDRVKPLVFSKGEKIMREGDPVQKMIFIVHGRIKRSQTLSKGTLAANTLQPGTIIGDELLSWCLRRPFIDRLPASNATFKCLQPTEAFSLEFDDLRYITDHFRYRFANEKVKRTARYYSSNWRNWAAVNIQFAWRRYRTGIIRVPVSSETENGGGEIRLRRYAAVFMSIRPHDHLE